VNVAAPAAAEQLIVSIGPHKYAFPAEFVREVLPMPQFLRADGAQEGAGAAFVLGGERVGVIDLAPELGLGSSSRTESDRLVLLEAGTLRCGVIVRAALGGHALPVRISAGLAGAGGPPPSALVNEWALDRNERIGILDPDSVFALATKDQIARSTLSGREAPVEMLVFTSGGRSYALPLTSVEGIADLGSLAPIPRAPGFVRGLVNFRGDILVAVEPSTLVGPEVGGFADLAHVAAIVAGGRRVALLLEKNPRVLVARSSDFQPVPSSPANALIAGLREGTALLDPAALIDRALGGLGRTA
jgi:purine-binding chemotaxis protein CheW